MRLYPDFRYCFLENEFCDFKPGTCLKDQVLFCWLNLVTARHSTGSILYDTKIIQFIINSKSASLEIFLPIDADNKT